MCTVSYIPTESGFILTSNRDEAPARETAAPEKFALPGGRNVIAPRDMEKGGTWIALDETARAACLLNGAFGKHKRNLPYRRSRGHFVLEAIDAVSFKLFVETVDLDGVEPFTLLLIDTGRILKLLWDGNRKYSWQLPSQAIHLWSSPTLYSPLEHSQKEHHFKLSLLQQGKDADTLLGIHGRDGTTPFILNRPGVRTLSISQLICSEGKGYFQYHLKNNDSEKASVISSDSDDF
jgi:uncharacterized protein with NRDE domain